MSNEIDIVVAAGYSLQIKGGGTNTGSNFLTQTGLTAGFKSGTSVTSALGANGGTLNVYVGGYSRSSSGTITVLVDNQDLVISDGTSSVRVKFADFSTDTSSGNVGTQDTATLNDLTIYLDTKGDITALTNGNSTTVAKNGQSGSATGDFQIVVSNSGQTVTTNVDTNSSTTVSIANSAFGSTFNFKADDSAMVAGQTANVKVTNDTGDGENDLRVVFNAAGDASINVKAVDVTALGLLINASVSKWATDTNSTAAITEIDAALKSLRLSGQALATNLGVIQTREDFTDQFINTLQEGAASRPWPTSMRKAPTCRPGRPASGWAFRPRPSPARRSRESSPSSARMTTPFVGERGLRALHFAPGRSPKTHFRRQGPRPRRRLNGSGSERQEICANEIRRGHRRLLRHPGPRRVDGGGREIPPGGRLGSRIRGRLSGVRAQSGQVETYRNHRGCGRQVPRPLAGGCVRGTPGTVGRQGRGRVPGFRGGDRLAPGGGNGDRH